MSRVKLAGLGRARIADETDGPSGLLTLGIEPQPPQELKNVERVFEHSRRST
jgi:hypothetical protein